MNAPASEVLIIIDFPDGTNGTYMVLETFPCREHTIIILANNAHLEARLPIVETITGLLVPLEEGWKVETINDPVLREEAHAIAQAICANWGDATTN